MQSESLNSRGSVASRVLYFVAGQCLPEQCGVDAVITLDIFQTFDVYKVAKMVHRNGSDI